MDILANLNGAYVNSFRSLLGLSKRVINESGDDDISKGISLWAKFLQQAEDGTKKHLSSFYWKHREILLSPQLEEILKTSGDKLVLAYDLSEESQLTKKQKSGLAETKLYLSHIYQQALLEASSSSASNSSANQLLMYLFRIMYLVSPILDGERVKQIMQTYESKCGEVSLLSSLVQREQKSESSTSSNPLGALANLNFGQIVSEATKVLSQFMKGDGTPVGKEMMETITKNVDPAMQETVTKALNDISGTSMDEIVNNAVAAVGGLVRNISTKDGENTATVAETAIHPE